MQSRKSENYTLVTECAKSEILSRNIVENKTPSCDDNILNVRNPKSEVPKPDVGKLKVDGPNKNSELRN